LIHVHNFTIRPPRWDAQTSRIGLVPIPTVVEHGRGHNGPATPDTDSTRVAIQATCHEWAVKRSLEKSKNPPRILWNWWDDVI
jgi:hypothetical protein